MKKVLIYTMFKSRGDFILISNVASRAKRRLEDIFHFKFEQDDFNSGIMVIKPKGIFFPPSDRKEKACGFPSTSDIEAEDVFKAVCGLWSYSRDN